MPNLRETWHLLFTLDFHNNKTARLERIIEVYPSSDNVLLYLITKTGGEAYNPSIKQMLERLLRLRLPHYPNDNRAQLLETRQNVEIIASRTHKISTTAGG